MLLDLGCLEWAREATRTGAPLVLRGVGVGGLLATAKRIAMAAVMLPSPSCR